jgi:hypothetical protein
MEFVVAKNCSEKEVVAATADLKMATSGPK